MHIDVQIEHACVRAPAWFTQHCTCSILYIGMLYISRYMLGYFKCIPPNMGGMSTECIEP